MENKLKYFMTINVNSTEETANIICCDDKVTLLVYIYKALENNPNQRNFEINITNREAYFATTK